MTVYIVIFDRKAYQISEKLFSDLSLIHIYGICTGFGQSERSGRFPNG